jgi:hypothetical protein
VSRLGSRHSTPKAATRFDGRVTINNPSAWSFRWWIRKLSQGSNSAARRTADTVQHAILRILPEMFEGKRLMNV